MYCGNCGSQVKTDSRFCSSCGAVLEWDYNNQINHSSTYKTASGKHSKNKKPKRTVLIACCLAVIILITGTVFVFGRNEKPEIVAEKYITALLEFDYDTLSKYSAIDWNTFIKNVNYNLHGTVYRVSDILMDYYRTTDFKTLFEGKMKELFYTDVGGLSYYNSYKFNATTKSKNITESSKIKNHIDEYAETFREYSIFKDINFNNFIELEKIEALCEVNGTVILNHPTEPFGDVFIISCIKIDGKWKVLDDASYYLSVAEFMNVYLPPL